MLNIEKETSINFNDAENEAVICTYNAAWLRKMDALCERHEGAASESGKKDTGNMLCQKSM